MFFCLLQDCNDFKAGNKIRSQARREKLDVTGLFGCSCRHEIPLSFMNLRHGERSVEFELIVILGLKFQALHKTCTIVNTCICHPYN